MQTKSLFFTQSNLTLFLIFSFATHLSAHQYQQNAAIGAGSQEFFDDEDEDEYFIRELPPLADFWTNEHFFIKDLLDYKRRGGTFTSLTLEDTQRYRDVCLSISRLLKFRHENGMSRKNRYALYTAGASTLTAASCMLFIYLFLKRATLLKQSTIASVALFFTLLTIRYYGKSNEISNPTAGFIDHIEHSEIIKGITDVDEIIESLEANIRHQQANHELSAQEP